MNFSMSYKNVEVREPVEKECAPHLKKMNKLLKAYEPDLVQMHGAFELLSKKSEYTFSLNLKLPTGTLHCVGAGSDIRKSLKAAFAELEGQIKKHQSRLRRDYEWKRKRPRAPLPA